MNWEGKTLWKWDLWENLSQLHYNWGDKPNFSLTNTNSIEYVKKNPWTQKTGFLLSSRNLNLLFFVEYPSGKIVWQNRLNSFSRQHDASFVGADKILVFDNGIGEISTMKAVEFNAKTEKVIWQWQPVSSAVTTSTMGGVRKLTNGSYLISDSNNGHLLEINPQGQIVWSYLLMPYNTIEDNPWPLGVSFFRAEVYPQSFINSFLSK